MKKEDGGLQRFDEVDDEQKKIFLQRYRLTISCCLHSSTYDYESLKEILKKAGSLLLLTNIS